MAGHQPQKKRRIMTASQLHRKRELDRESQRASREKTKKHVAYLENVVRSLRQNEDDRVRDLLGQLSDKEAQIRKLCVVINNIAKLTKITAIETSVALVRTAPDVPGQSNEPGPPSPQLSGVLSFEGAMEGDISQPALAPTNDPRPPLLSSAAPIVQGFSPPPQVLSHFSQHESIAQIAGSIVSTNGLEGRLWYLAGALLNHLLAMRSSISITTTFDEDIPIRAVCHGWSSVVERHPLDKGWQWLRELDERIYFRSPIPFRLMSLRNSRLILLKQLFPNDNRNEALIPSFFAARPSQIFVRHDPLVDHFPWPSLRETLLFSPRKFATNSFMDALRNYGHFIFDGDVADMYVQDSTTGLYHYSEIMIQHLMDIRSYAARPEFFEQFPELRREIPCAEVSPCSQTSNNPRQIVECSSQAERGLIT